jgi:hypothetical protein
MITVKWKRPDHKLQIHLITVGIITIQGRQIMQVIGRPPAAL